MSHNTWIHKISRLAVARPLAGTGITPNQVTALRLGTGVAAAACLAAGPGAAMNLGAGLFLVSFILDRADGDLARLTGQESRRGHRYDLIADTLCNALIFVGLGIGLRDGAYGGLAVVMGIVAGLAVAGVFARVVRLEAEEGPRAGEIAGIAGMDPDDAMLAVPLALWVGWAEQLLLAAAVGAPAFAIFFVLYASVPGRVH